MSMIDIRDSSGEEINIIKFSDTNIDIYSISELQLYNDCVYINSYQEVTNGRKATSPYLSVCSKQDAENLIKAIQKAIELEWWED